MAVNSEGKVAFLQPGDPLWVGHGMARGYDLPFGKKLTVKKVRILFMMEARVVFEEYPRRFYLRTDFGQDYAYRNDPKNHYQFSPEQWETIRRGTITVGMEKQMFLLIKPKSEEIHYQTNPRGPIEQWIYREHPRILYGATEPKPAYRNLLFSKRHIDYHYVTLNGMTDSKGRSGEETTGAGS